MRRSWGFVALCLVIAMAAANGAAGEKLTANGKKAVDASWLGPPSPGQSNRPPNSIAGEMYADMLGTSINAQRTFRSALPSIFSYSQTARRQNYADAGLYADGTVANFAAESYYGYCPTTMCSPGSKWVMWDVPFFTKETHKNTGDYLGYEQNLSGFATGISRIIGETSAIGLAVGYDHRKLKGRDGYLMENKGTPFTSPCTAAPILATGLSTDTPGFPVHGIKPNATGKGIPISNPVTKVNPMTMCIPPG